MWFAGDEVLLNDDYNQIKDITENQKVQYLFQDRISNNV